MRIAIIGPGALGCLLACRLSCASGKQSDVLLIDHRPERAKLLDEQGIVCESDGEKHRISLPVSSTPEHATPPDILFFCVKSHDLEESLTFVAPLLSPAGLIIFMQNGITHLDLEHADWLQGIPVFATSSEGATLLEPGHIRHGGSGHTHFGFLTPRSKPENERLQVLTALLQKGKIAASVSNDIRSRLWAKLFVNVGINALTAIYSRTNGRLLTSLDTLSKLKTLVKEAEQVARASGITIKEDPVAATITVCERTAVNTSSMLQDIRNCRPTEIDSINGAISRLGKELNIATPANDAVIAQIKTIEAGYNAP
ncbi:MAG: 2-dehydropantoate 2-reductase [Desulfocapsa sp.]|nr:2-dehydropantoate 2-reductase [Desulfocapsa sp.]